MALVLTAAPAAEPLSLAEANLRIDANDEDALLNALIAAARISVTAIEVTGLAELRRRLEAASAPESFKKALREEAEDDCGRGAPGGAGRASSHHRGSGCEPGRDACLHRQHCRPRRQGRRVRDPEATGDALALADFQGPFTGD